MNEMTTVQKVWAAKGAAWWVLLINVGILTVSWLAFLAMMAHKPACVVAMWGGNVDWGTIQVISLWMVGIYKLIIYVNFMLAMWLTFWHHRLKKVR